MKSVDEVLTRLAFCVHAGHVHSGMESSAMEGASNVNVPPWRMGSLEMINTMQYESTNHQIQYLWVMLRLTETQCLCACVCFLRPL